MASWKLWSDYFDTEDEEPDDFVLACENFAKVARELIDGGFKQRRGRRRFEQAIQPLMKLDPKDRSEELYVLQHLARVALEAAAIFSRSPDPDDRRAFDFDRGRFELDVQALLIVAQVYWRSTKGAAVAA